MGENADLVRSAWEAFRRGDVDAAVANTDPDVEIVVPESLPWGGTYKGHGGLREMLGKLTSNPPPVAARPKAFWEAEDDHVVVPLEGGGQSDGGDKPAGDACWIYQVRDGKLARAQFFTDTAKTLSALGQ